MIVSRLNKNLSSEQTRQGCVWYGAAMERDEHAKAGGAPKLWGRFRVC